MPERRLTPEEIQEMLKEEEMPEFPEETEEPLLAPPEDEDLKIEDYINLPPDLRDIQFVRSGELVDLKILNENIYLHEKKNYIVLMLAGLILFAIGVL